MPDDAGLTSQLAAARLAEFGRNEFPRPPRPSIAGRLVKQLGEPMALLLLVAAGIAGLALGERVDAAAIAAIVLLNALIALAEEEKASRALESLQQLQSPSATVVRDGRNIIIPAAEVVPGDLVALSGGDRVPADIQLSPGAALDIDESLLTGESLPVEKRGSGDEPGAIALSGTLVTRGSALGVAIATGPRTRLGRIAGAAAGQSPPSPLQLELKELTGKLAIIAVAAAAAVFLLEAFVGEDGGTRLQDAFLSSVALAVAAVPEGLATVVAVALALGVRRMALRGAIVRDLPSVETLGATTVILTDKTGTLTRNRMRVGEAALPDHNAASVKDLSGSEFDELRRVVCLCNDASLQPPVGDPLEIALLEAAGADEVERLARAHPRVASMPFNSNTRLMATLNAAGPSMLLLVKGAPESVLRRCSAATDSDRALEQASAMARRGIRVIAAAMRQLSGPPVSIEQTLEDLTLTGLVGLVDPARPEARAAVNRAESAGIKVVMVTGDHPGTARRIAEEVALGTGTDLQVQVGAGRGTGADVYARVEPEDKLALVDAYRAAGEVVAVTGDGVNDAPALRRADIGVAMGASGSDAARESANLVITDDNLATIVDAVQEGRGIYANIRSVVDYLVAANLSEVIVMIAGLIAFPQLGVPLLPLQLLWINLITDGLPALAIGMRPVDPRVMARPPRSRNEKLLTTRTLARLAARGALLGISAIAVLAVSRFWLGQPWPHARALLFTALAFSQLAYAVTVHGPARRDDGHRRSLWLPGALVLGVVLQALVVVWPPARRVFDTAHISGEEWVLVLVGSLLPALLIPALEHLAGRGSTT